MGDSLRRHFAEVAHRSGYVVDDAQQRAVLRLSELGAELTRFFRGTPRGVYLWGPVGRGKTWLMDAFFTGVAVRRKKRVHFHDFFRGLHDAVFRNPGAFDAAVGELLDDCELLCFDEFHLHDIGDGMLLARLLRDLFDRKIALVATSNYPPSGLLPNPLYHHLILPTVELIERRMDVVDISGPVDYRSLPGERTGFGSGAWLWPGDRRQLAGQGLVEPTAGERTRVPIGDRALTARAVREDLVWFDFHDLCERPVAAVDYLALADRFATFVVAGVPLMASCAPDARQRFVNLVDVLCDRGARLVVLGQGPVAEALSGDDLPADLARTASRLSLLRG